MSRYQLAVCPSISARALAEGAHRGLGSPAAALARAAADVRAAFGATGCVLTDSGTSALVLALRVMVGRGGVVALPGYGCVDLAAAVRFAGVRVRLYDVDPATLSPDLASVEAALHRGVDAVLVAHFYGYPADVGAIRELADGFGVPVLEDAAQAAGGSLGTSRLGTLGDLSVLSFGRGKGLFAGRGGALMAFTPEWNERLAAVDTLATRRGIGNLAAATAQWVFGRPELYGLPASVPWLHLGEMIYHPAQEPRALSGSAAALVPSALASESKERARRQATAAALRAFVRDGRRIRAVQTVERGDGGFLRFAVLDESQSRSAAPRLGIMRGYPRTLSEQEELRPQLLDGEPATPGATALRESLFTLPTHARVTDRDLFDINEWIYAPATGSCCSSATKRADAALRAPVRGVLSP